MTEEKPEDAVSKPPNTPTPPRRIQENDPYPRMILVCIAITFVLFFVVMGVILFDLVQSDAFLPGETGAAPGFPPIPAPESAPPTD